MKNNGAPVAGSIEEALHLHRAMVDETNRNGEVRRAARREIAAKTTAFVEELERLYPNQHQSISQILDGIGQDQMRKYERLEKEERRKKK